MIKKILLNTLLGSILLTLQIGFVSALPSPINDLNIVLVVIVFILGMYNFRVASLWVVGLGLILDIYSFHFFGANMLVLFTLLLSVNFLLNNFFTDRSIYSFLALSFFSLIFHEVSMISLYFVEIYFSQKSFNVILNEDYFYGRIVMILVNLIFTIIAFWILNFLSKRLKPVFLFK